LRAKDNLPVGDGGEGDEFVRTRKTRASAGMRLKLKLQQGVLLARWRMKKGNPAGAAGGIFCNLSRPIP